MATKFVYSTTEISEIVEKYKSGTSLEVLANTYNKSVASIRMKLVKLGVYVAKTKSSSTPAKSKLQEKTDNINAFIASLMAVGEAPF